MLTSNEMFASLYKIPVVNLQSSKIISSTLAMISEYIFLDVLDVNRFQDSYNYGLTQRPSYNLSQVKVKNPYACLTIVHVLVLYLTQIKIHLPHETCYFHIIVKKKQCDKSTLNS